MSEYTGTPISRRGGYLIRVGWRAVGYSVDQRTESQYRRTKLALLIVAIITGVATAYGVDHLLFQVIDPVVGARTALIRSYPELWRLVIYFLTLFFGALIYGQIIAIFGKRIARGGERRDEGLPLIEQRRRAAFSRKSEFATALMALSFVWFWPDLFGMAFKLLALLVFGGRFLEGLYFKFKA